ncbi:MAG: twin-arginine translocase TatA/TatE family subunit [Bacteroidia bacterium]|nr:twin-arginine translocase TatA/TatE family subunit [Bacteroidia bacterium]
MILLAISGGHIIIVVVALLLLFGGKKIPELMGGLGKGMKDFKKAIKEDDDTPVESSNKVTPEAVNKKEPLKE